jgi:predicted signal transduction protein with EAL and GGDEF domain
VLCANNDTCRDGRGSAGNHPSVRRGGSFAYLRNFPIDYLKIDGSFMLQLKDNRVERATVESQRAALDRFDKTATAVGGAPVRRAHLGGEDG